MGRTFLTAAGLLVLTACSGSDDGASGPIPPASPPVTETTLGAAASAAPTTSAAAATTAAGTTAADTTAAARPNLDAVRVALTEIGTFEEPVALVDRRGTLHVAEKTGRVLALTQGEPRVVLDMTDLTRSSGEQGLLGLAFSPDGALMYVSYTDTDGDSRVDEYVMEGDEADPASRREILFLDQPYPNHNGGHVAFGPDGLLYLGYGDGGSGGDPQRYGQDPGTWLGKLLRIDPRPSGGQPYTIPPDNPFADGSLALPEIWSTGLRNPWRFSFDPATGDLWIGDVGQNAVEEIDLVPAADGAGRGTNFGWSAFEGSEPFNDDEDAPDQWAPIYEYRHSDGGCSVTGGVVYRGSAIPALRGAYLFGDYCSPGVVALVVDGGQVADAALIAEDPGRISSFGTDAGGEVYVLSLSGPVYRVDPA